MFIYYSLIFYLLNILEINGGARSSVEECLLREEEATGSNPVESIDIYKKVNERGDVNADDATNGL